MAGVCAIGADLLVLWLEGSRDPRLRAEQVRLALYEGKRRRWARVPEPGVQPLAGQSVVTFVRSFVSLPCSFVWHHFWPRV